MAPGLFLLCSNRAGRPPGTARQQPSYASTLIASGNLSVESPRYAGEDAVDVLDPALDADDARVAVRLDAAASAAAPAVKLTRQTAIAYNPSVAAGAGDLDQHEREQTPDGERASSRRSAWKGGRPKQPRRPRWKIAPLGGAASSPCGGPSGLASRDAVLQVKLPHLGRRRRWARNSSPRIGWVLGLPS